ncbi:MAG: hypothetical protein HYR73_06945 [Candidatus Eisenbacteria bacterium]|nr:hypothetical protein [Candidatus Eisenbacteria bacterium]
MLMGPYGSHQRPAIDALLTRGGVRIATAAEFPEALASVMREPQIRASLREGGLGAVGAMRGATRRTVRALVAHGLWPVER